MQYPITIQLSERKEEIYTRKVTFTEEELNRNPTLKQLILNEDWEYFADNIDDFEGEDDIKEDVSAIIEVTDGEGNKIHDFCCY